MQGYYTEATPAGGADPIPGDSSLTFADRVNCHVFLLTPAPRDRNAWVVGYGLDNLNRRRKIEVLRESDMIGMVGS